MSDNTKATATSDTHKSPTSSTSHLRWLAAVLVIGTALRFWKLGATDFWNDEIFTILKTDNLMQVLTTGKYVSNHPPLFEILLFLWRQLYSFDSEFFLRALPAIIGVAGVAAIYFLGKIMYCSRVGLWAAFLLSISPAFILHSRDLKPYILLPFTSTIMLCFLYLATNTNKKLHWAGYGLSAALCCYSELFAGPLLIAVNLWFLLQIAGRKDRLVPWVTANIIGFCLFLPQLGIMLEKASGILIESSNWWVPKPTLWGIAFYLKTLAFGYSDLQPHFKVALLLYMALFILGTIAALKTAWRTGLLCVLWFVAPIAITYALSLYLESIFLIRMMLPCAIPFYLLIAFALSRIRGTKSIAVTIAVLIMVAGFSLREYYSGRFPVAEFPHRPGVHAPYPYKDGSALILSQIRDDDIIIHSACPTWLTFSWYGLSDRKQQTAAIDSWIIRDFLKGGPRTTNDPVFDYYFPHQLQPLVENKNRVWFVFSDWERAYFQYNPMDVWRWLDSHYVEILHRDYVGFEVFLYQRFNDELGAQTLSRNRDDGVSVEMTYAYKPNSVYTKIDPDDSLEHFSIEERRGRLELRFAEEADGTSGDQMPNNNEASFFIENTSSDNVTCRVECVPSSYLVNLPTLYEAQPDSDVWKITRMTNPEGIPSSYEIAGLMCRLASDDSADLHGNVQLSPGTYQVNAYLRYDPKFFAKADLDILMGKQSLMRSFNDEAADTERWHWTALSTVNISEENASTPLRLFAQAKGTKEGIWLDISYLTLHRLGEGRQDIDETDPIVDKITLEPGEERRFSLDANESADRVDIWVYEQGERGQAYKIYKILDRG